MTTTQSNVLLVVSESQNTAKRIESHMRNSGHPVRAAWVTDMEDVEDAIKRASPDLVLCSENMEFAPHGEVIELCARISPDLPVLLMGGDVGLDESSRALAVGARDMVCGTEDEYLPHLEKVCLREIVNHRHLRELRTSRIQLSQFESRHKQLLAGTAEAVAHIQEGIVSGCNPALAQRLGYAAADELENQLFMDLIAPDSMNEAKDAFKQLQKGKLDQIDLSLSLRHVDGHAVPSEVQLSREDDGSSTDIQLLVHADELPGDNEPDQAAPTRLRRAALVAALHELRTDDTQGPAALLVIQFDGFAEMEQRLGFVDAEQLTLTLTDLITARLSEADQAFAFGDGAVALLAHADDEAVFDSFADTLRKDVAAQIFKTDSFETHATVSIAAYPVGEQSPNAAEILNDTAAQVRKISRDGGNRFTVMGETAQAAQEQRDIARRADDVKRAIEQDRLKLAYQSIASLDGSDQQIYDVFVRMVDEGGRELLAREFLPAAEKAGLMRLIDRWVINKALRHLARHKGREAPPTFFIRLSEDTARDAEGFIKWAMDLVRKVPGANEHIVFEVQEAIVEKHVRKATLMAKALENAGVGLALDYFGQSPTCVNLLDEMPARFVKFHYSYTERFSEPETGKRFRDLMEAAKQRGLKTIVSQVEQASDMAVLWQLGVNYIQGNSVQEPEVVMLAADVSLG